MPFHVAVPVHDLAAARAFYKDVLGCAEGRSAKRWVDFNLFGHQFVCHLSTVDTDPAQVAGAINKVDGQDVPVPHYGVVMSMYDWEELIARLRQHGVGFMIEPSVRFRGKPGEQATAFVADPSGNVLEFKAFQDLEQLFVR
jgi:extradiol dioxygenase family protein